MFITLDSPILISQIVVQNLFQSYRAHKNSIECFSFLILDLQSAFLIHDIVSQEFKSQ